MTLEGAFPFLEFLTPEVRGLTAGGDGTPEVTEHRQALLAPGRKAARLCPSLLSVDRSPGLWVRILALPVADTDCQFSKKKGKKGRKGGGDGRLESLARSHALVQRFQKAQATGLLKRAARRVFLCRH